MKRYLPTILLALTLASGEIHTFWSKSALYETTNWIWKRPTPMALDWNIKYAVLQFNYIIWFVAMFLYGKYPNRINKTTVIAFICFAILDTIMYFYNYKVYKYGGAYWLFLALWVFTYFWRGKSKVSLPDNPEKWKKQNQKK